MLPAIGLVGGFASRMTQNNLCIFDMYIVYTLHKYMHLMPTYVYKTGNIFFTIFLKEISTFDMMRLVVYFGKFWFDLGSQSFC